MNPIIEISHLTKRFVIYRRQYGMKNLLLHFPQYLHDMAHAHTYTALDDVSFSVMPGERIGITGHNGCGKTTLLSVIGGVLKQYAGTVHVRGRVSMMLALGAGFCFELSGRENIILNGVLQGKTRREMLALMDDIVAFADLGEFIDSPIYQYSSGMQMRLGFGIATAIEPEILLVDEVMAVGDVEFSGKCEMRINKLLEGGTTLLLVSHNPADLSKYCNRILRIARGKVVADECV